MGAATRYKAMVVRQVDTTVDGYFLNRYVVEPVEVSAVTSADAAYELACMQVAGSIDGIVSLKHWSEE